MEIAHVTHTVVHGDAFGRNHVVDSENHDGGFRCGLDGLFDHTQGLDDVGFLHVNDAAFVDVDAGVALAVSVCFAQLDEGQ